MDEQLGEQFRSAGKLDLDSSVRLVPATDIIGASTEQALADAHAWLGSAREGAHEPSNK